MLIESEGIGDGTWYQGFQIGHSIGLPLHSLRWPDATELGPIRVARPGQRIKDCGPVTLAVAARWKDLDLAVVTVGEGPRTYEPGRRHNPLANDWVRVTWVWPDLRGLVQPGSQVCRVMSTETLQSYTYRVGWQSVVNKQLRVCVLDFVPWPGLSGSMVRFPGDGSIVGFVHGRAGSFGQNALILVGAAVQIEE